MPEDIRCSECGAHLPIGTPKGLCSRCALLGALELTNGESQVLQPENSGDASPPQPAKPVGQLPTLKYFGDYELLEEIARGGMGIVFKARQASLNRVVAVKLLLRGEYASEDFIKRFRIEASAAASLQHPNIVAIHEVGVHQGQHYFAMDLVDGPNLAQLLRDGPLPARRAAGYVKIIAEAIHFAHTRQILHRDLKPSNVLIDSNDQPRVTDFGLAKNLANGSDLTVTGQVCGSPSFMPPEQASGQREKVCVMSDVYSLGAILYHALTGRPPFVGQSVAETLKQVENTEPIAPRLLNSGVPRDLETICLKCLQKEPGKRYTSAQELARELGRFLGDEPIHAHPVSRPEKIWRWCRRKPAIAGMAAAIALVTAMGIVGWLVAQNRGAVADRAKAAKVKADQNAARETQQAAELFEANSAFLLQQALMDTNNLRGPALLKALEEAISRQPQNLALWRAKSEVLKRENRFEDALDSLSKAIELTSTDTNEPSRMRIEMLLTRATLLRNMSRKSEADVDYHEAGRINCQRKRLPNRDPQTKPAMLDLSPFFQSRLPSLLNMLSTDEEAANTIREDVTRNTGVEFDLRGGMNVYGEMKYLLTGIAVNRRFLRLHVLHSVWGSGTQNATIAVYVLHYADGQTKEISVRYGQHVRDVWRRDPRPPTDALVAWTGDSNGANKDSRGVQFFKTTLENPRPEAEVRSIDFSPRSNDVYPIVLGITVEEAEPGSPEFWTTKAKSLEDQGNSAEALNTLEQAIRQLPGNPILWDSKGRFFERAGRTNEAFEAYTKAIELADGDEKRELRNGILLRRSDVLRRMQRVPEAAMDYRRAKGLPYNHIPPEALPDYSQATTVSMEFGTTNREQGLYVLDVGGSKYTPVTGDGEEAWFFAPGVNYAYFFVDPTFKWTLSNAVVRVEYHVVRGNPIGLHYDGQQGTYSLPTYSVNKGETGQWQVIEFVLHDTRFRNAQNGGADFRLQDNQSGFYLRRITVSHYKRGVIPSRPASTSSNQLDLTTNYDSGIRHQLPVPDLAAITNIQQTIRNVTGIDFDPRGLVTLSGQDKKRPRTTNIPLNRRVRQLHFLQAAESTERDGTQIGSYMIHFSDGSDVELPLIYGHNIRAYSDYKSTPEARAVVWAKKGTQTQAAAKIQVFAFTWVNPRPESEVRSVDFVVSGTRSAPNLLAITAE